MSSSSKHIVYFLLTYGEDDILNIYELKKRKTKDYPIKRWIKLHLSAGVWHVLCK